jgi:hypothetical protein
MSSNIETEPNAQKLYRYYVNSVQVLNVIPPEKVIKKKHYVNIYNVLYYGILKNYIELKVKKLLLPCGTCDDYKELLNMILEIFCIKLGDIEPRIVLTEPDGTVIIDTYKKTLNTFTNWKNKIINENHNSRISIKNAQYYDGVGYEKKVSSTIPPVYQYGVAVRLGNKHENYGTLRLSRNVYC